MNTFFTDSWVSTLRDKWNRDPEMTTPLGQANFNAVIAFGLIDDLDPRVIVKVVNGLIERAEMYRGGSYEADWDLRAASGTWAKWQTSGLGLTGLGVAVSSGTLQFRKGDYRRLIRTPALAGPFLKFFSLL